MLHSVCQRAACLLADSTGPGDPQDFQAVLFSPRPFGARWLEYSGALSFPQLVQGRVLTRLRFGLN